MLAGTAGEAVARGAMGDAEAGRVPLAGEVAGRALLPAVAAGDESVAVPGAREAAGLGVAVGLLPGFAIASSSETVANLKPFAVS